MGSTAGQAPEWTVSITAMCRIEPLLTIDRPSRCGPPLLSKSAMSPIAIQTILGLEESCSSLDHMTATSTRKTND